MSRIRTIKQNIICIRKNERKFARNFEEQELFITFSKKTKIAEWRICKDCCHNITLVSKSCSDMDAFGVVLKPTLGKKNIFQKHFLQTQKWKFWK